MQDTGGKEGRGGNKQGKKKERKKEKGNEEEKEGSGNVMVEGRKERRKDGKNERKKEGKNEGRREGGRWWQYDCGRKKGRKEGHTTHVCGRCSLEVLSKEGRRKERGEERERGRKGAE